MSILILALIFNFIGSVLSLIGGVLLLIKEKRMLKISHLLASFAAGSLLGATFFDLLPEAAHGSQDSNTDIFLWTLVGFLFFFLLERFLHWFHHHDGHHGHMAEDAKPIIPLIVVGDSIHNFIDGVAIATTFLISVPLGIVTTLAVAAHEIPQEIGDFALLLHKGVKKWNVLLINLFSAATSILGVLIVFTVGEKAEGILPILLSLTAGFFLYIAASDLIPEIHHENRKGFALFESLLLILGVLVIWLTVNSLSGFGI